LIAGRETPWYSHTTYHSGLARTANPLDGVFVGRRVFTQTTSIEASHKKGLIKEGQTLRLPIEMDSRTNKRSENATQKNKD
jgi:hypothetical protein